MLLDMLAAGRSYVLIGAKLKRTRHAIIDRLRTLDRDAGGMPKDGATQARTSCG